MVRPPRLLGKGRVRMGSFFFKRSVSSLGHGLFSICFFTFECFFDIFLFWGAECVLIVSGIDLQKLYYFYGFIDKGGLRYHSNNNNKNNKARMGRNGRDGRL